MTDQAVIDRLGLAAKSARDHAEQVLEQPLMFRLEWSHRLTSSAGVAVVPTNGDRPKVRLSSPIFLNAIGEIGAAAACEQVRKTTLHEIAHIVAGPGARHGAKWREVMWTLGVDPGANQYHYMTCGAGLNTVAREIVQEYPIGTWVEYQARGRQFVGEVKRHNAKTLSVTQESELVGGFWEDTGTRKWWRIPWRLVEDAIIEIVE